MTELAPVVLFTYSRIDHTKKTVESLKTNILASQTKLYIVSDGARGESDMESVRSVREYCKTISGFAEVRLICRKKNFGLGRNIISGLNQIFRKYDRAIILEDDIVTSPMFLSFMNLALNRYKDNTEVMSISGYVAPFDKTDVPDFFFSYWFECWGWATWKKRWEKFERNPRNLIRNTNRKEIKYINVNGTSPDMWDQVIENYLRRRYTWAIFNHITICKERGLVLYPRDTYCQNIGFDGTGENCDASNEYHVLLKRSDQKEIVLPKRCNVSKQAIRNFELFNKKRIREKGFFWNLRIKIRALLVGCFVDK